jgi:hypothetical protein
MRNALWLAIILLLSLGIAHGQKQGWNLSRDIRAAASQISFAQGSNGVWYFMESASLRHNPEIYSFLSDYAAPCVGNPAGTLIDGLACWQDPSHTIDHAPLVAVNFTNQIQYPLYFPIPPHAVIMHPAPDRFAIVAWKSPVKAIVKVSAAFTDLDAACGNGILWSVDKGGERIVKGDLPNGGSQTFVIPSVAVLAGQVLYFVVDPKDGDYICDATQVDVTINQIQ